MILLCYASGSGQSEDDKIIFARIWLLPLSSVFVRGKRCIGVAKGARNFLKWSPASLLIPAKVSKMRYVPVSFPLMPYYNNEDGGDANTHRYVAAELL
jgi:hypothetical protein